MAVNAPQSAQPEPAGEQQQGSADPASEPTPAQLKEKLADVEDRLLRAMAEQENIRRIANRERTEAARHGAAELARDLLETADNLERAMILPTGADPSEATLARYAAGVSATHRGLLATLGRHGIRRIDPMGEAFDPAFHQAVSQRLGAWPDGTIVAVVQPGYFQHDRLLRPAMVVVAASAADTPETQ